MTTTTAMPASADTRLDFALLRRISFYFAVLNLFVAPFVSDPFSYAAGAATAFALLSLVGTPTMPKGVAFFLLWQWAQTFTRALQSVFDGESMAAGIAGPDVLLAYWYALASLIVMALAFRLVLGNIKSPTVRDYYAHERWRAQDLILVYVAAIVASVFFNLASRQVSALEQPLYAASQVKVVALFLLCTYVFTTGRGAGTLVAAIFIEIVVGFTGFLSDFRAVFIYVAVAALAARVRWTFTFSIAATLWLSALLLLALFWTSVKADYRDYLTGYDENSQAIRIPLEERMAYLGDKALNIGDTKWGETAYMLIARFAYIDVFGQVISVADNTPEATSMRQWKDGLSHVFQPRILFPGKAALSDTEVYMRLTRADPTEQVRLGTSISVGYMGENYVDLGFPGMLAGVFVIGVALALIMKYFMSRPLPWMLREGIVMGFAFSAGGVGMEMSLPKILGAMVMFFVVWALIAKIALPIVMRWLDHRAGVPRTAAS
ncbi:MAG: hypothetical protein IKE60_26605 [Reyranella sp.]|uniref:hypothetical protein n=1 Tax=Reyranella sp. TaxID=1929291 RepID=UPI001ACF38D3|nr:hypothetical protein [Reyranella sp.]MBN9538578.1 hypothetical protein [Alphaproteobacteria bacterium]MBR2818262.1 hypothetical protein [Reyranella sp.]